MIDAIRELARHARRLVRRPEAGPHPQRVARAAHRDGVRGLTTNPSIYEKAIGGTSDYDADIAALAAAARREDHLRGAGGQDLRAAAGLLRPVWDATDGRDGS
jgi:transaldolase